MRSQELESENSLLNSGPTAETQQSDETPARNWVAAMSGKGRPTSTPQAGVSCLRLTKWWGRRQCGPSLGLLNYADDYSGFHWAGVNYTVGGFLGWQLAFVNYTAGTMKGLQTGFVNYAGKLTGLPFGFVNVADSAETGLQIGLVNLMPENEWFSDMPDELAPGMVLVNWHF